MDKLIKWAMEIQSLAQAGLAYTNNVYDIERYERLREISAEMIEEKTNREQIEMCFEAHKDVNWQTQFD